MPTYQVLKQIRTPHRLTYPDGLVVEDMRISFRPLVKHGGTPLLFEAENPDEAFAILRDYWGAPARFSAQLFAVEEIERGDDDKQN